MSVFKKHKPHFEASFVLFPPVKKKTLPSQLPPIIIMVFARTSTLIALAAATLIALATPQGVTGTQGKRRDGLQRRRCEMRKIGFISRLCK